MSLARIQVKNLRLRTIIGCNDSERENLQDIIINLNLWYDPQGPMESDQIEEALNYRTLTKKVISFVESSSFFLLEKLCAQVLLLIMEEPLVEKAQVEIDKPAALRFADSVSLQMEMER